ncbi:protein C activator-like [Mercenaria mercenaria]|uniref:protein C activator-like n=1 Tax=Mercenaria mercenaria TaxID=6596 RepID=UPI00234F1EA8|nr:protein C activator-like [Mercenaria mercenaria]
MPEKTFLWMAFVAVVVLCQSETIVERLKGAKNVRKGDFSFTVKIKRNGNDVCNGVMVDRKWILTLRNCINDRKLGSYKAYFTPMDSKAAKSDLVRSFKAFASNDANDDIILLRLNKKLRRRRDGVRPFDRIISGKNEGQLTNCKVIGFSSNGKIYKKVDVRMNSASKCGTSKKKTVCLNTFRGKVCEEDNGSPIVCKVDEVAEKKWYLMGLASVKKGCKASKIGGVRLSSKKDFISCVVSGKCPKEVPKAELGEACVNDKDCVINTICNGTCVCPQGYRNVSGICKACEGYACVSALTEESNEECIICNPECNSTFTVFRDINVEFLNPDSDSCYSESAGGYFKNRCRRICDITPICKHGFQLDDVCNIFTFGCLLRVTKGGNSSFWTRGC